MATISERQAKLQASIEAQAKKLAELKAKQAKIEARQRAAEKSEARKIDTRKKILAGAYALSLLEKKGEYATKFMAGLNGFLEKSADRELFGLPVRASTPEAKENPSQPSSQPAG